MPTYRKRHKRRHARVRRPKMANVPKYARANAKKSLMPSHAMYNTQFATIHKMPTAPAYITELDAELFGVVFGGSSGNTIPTTGFVIVPSDRTPFYNNSSSALANFLTGEQGVSPSVQGLCYRSFNQLSPLYSRYRMLSTKLSLELMPSGMTNDGGPTTSAHYDAYAIGVVPFSYAGHSYSATIPSYFQSLTDMLRNPYCTSKLTNSNAPGRACKVTNRIAVHDLYGLNKRAIVDDSEFEGLTESATVPISSATAYQIIIITDSCGSWYSDGGATKPTNNFYLKIRLKTLFLFDDYNAGTALSA